MPQTSPFGPRAPRPSTTPEFAAYLRSLTKADAVASTSPAPEHGAPTQEAPAASRAAAQKTVGAAPASAPVQGGAVQGGSLVDVRCGRKGPLPRLEVGVAWGTMVVPQTQQRSIDPVWFRVKNVVADDAATLEVRGDDGAWRKLPALLSRAETGADGKTSFTLQISVDEATSLGLTPTSKVSLRLRDAQGRESPASAPVVVNDFANPLTQPDHRPMEDRFPADDGLHGAEFVPTLPVPQAIDVDAIARAFTIGRDGAELVLSWPPGSLDPAVVLETHPPMFASGHGVKAALAYSGDDTTRVSPDGSATMRVSADGPRVVRARYAVGGQPVAVALVDGERTAPWSSKPFSYVGERGALSLYDVVTADRVHFSPNDRRIVGDAGTVPIGCSLSVHNVSAHGLRWASATYPRVAVKADGSFSIDVTDPAFGKLRVNDQVAIVVAPQVSGVEDGVVLRLTFDGTKLVDPRPASLAGARKNGTDIPPK